jgi:tRNA(Ile)-lysidine synthase TilS/MesJ
MIFCNEYGSVDFWSHITKDHKIPDIKNVAVTLSGGIDSAFIMFMLCEFISKNNLNIKVMPFTGVDTLRPANIWYAREVALYFEEKYPTIEFLPHYEFSYDHEPNNTMMKRNAHRVHEWNLYKDQNIQVFLCGKSANPPDDEAKKFGLYVDREAERDTDTGDQYKIFTRISDNEEQNRWIYRPLAFMHKKFIAECFKEHNLIDDLFPLTASCIGYANTTKNFSEPCKTCWWCKEKHWAFGMYDGGAQ